MKYLESFSLINEDENLEFVRKIKSKYTDDEWFPLNFFQKKRLFQVDLEPITIFYGGNGSGKSSLLNLIAEKLGLLRKTASAIPRGFSEYAKECKTKSPKELPQNSSMLTSEDVFKNIFSTRDKNIETDIKKAEVEEFFDYGGLDEQYGGISGSNMISKSLLKKQFVQKRVGFKERQYSNGEHAMHFFRTEIQRKTLYLLDEPENSMSPTFQLELKLFLEDCVKFFGCQFIIATHSPFILGLKGAKIYNLDRKPVSVENWFELKNVRTYYDFFKRNKELFELENLDTSKAIRRPTIKTQISPKPPVKPAVPQSPKAAVVPQNPPVKPAVPQSPKAAVVPQNSPVKPAVSRSPKVSAASQKPPTKPAASKKPKAEAVTPQKPAASKKPVAT